MATKTETAKAKLAAKSAPKKDVVHVASVFLDKDGEALENDIDIADAYRDAVNEEFGIETTLSNDEIVSIVRGIPGDETQGDAGAEVRDDRLEALKAASDPQILEDLSKPVSSIDAPTAILASKYGSLVDAETDKLIDKAADDKEGMEGAPLVIADHFANLWGGQRDELGFITRVAAVDEMPIPGTSEKNKPAGSNRPTDRYSYDDRADGKSRKGHFIGDLVDSMGLGKQLRSDIGDLINIGLGVDDKNINNKDLLSKEIKTNVNKCRDSMLDRLKARKQSRIRAVSRAIAFLQVVNRIEEECPKVQWGFTLPEGQNRIEEVSKLRKPIQFQTKSKGRDFTSIPPWSLSQFINLQNSVDGVVRLDKIKQAGGTIAAITDSLKRKKKGDGTDNQGGGKDTLGKDMPIPSPEQLDAFARMFNTGLDTAGGSDNRDKADAYRARLQQWLNVRTPERDEALMGLFDMHDMLGDVLAPYRRRREAINETQQKLADAQSEKPQAKAG